MTLFFQNKRGGGYSIQKGISKKFRKKIFIILKMTSILYNLVLKMTAEMRLLMRSKMTPYIIILKTKNNIQRYKVMRRQIMV